MNVIETTRPKILIAEDDEVLLGIMRQLCEARGCDVDIVADGDQALKKLMAEPYTLVISDIRMPVMDGYSLLKAVQEKKLDVPVVLISGYSDYDADQVDDQNGVALIEKPFSRVQFEEILDQFAKLLP